MDDLESRWRIKEFAGIVNVPEATLRAWERRYSLLEPDRSSGGFRLYSRADERRIRSMQAHMQRGLAPAQAAALALSESAVVVVPPRSAAELIDALIDAAEQFDATRFDTLLDGAFALGQLTAIREVVLPALVEVGLRWQSDRITVGHEHFASHLIERRLLTLAQGWEAGRGPLALLACPSGERHTLGLVCFGLVLADQGWRIAYLGADTPIEQVLAVSSKLDPTAVVLCARDARHLVVNAAEISELAAAQHTILAGDGASANLSRRLGAHHADGNPVDTALRLSERPARARSDPGLRTAQPAADGG